MSKRNNSSNQHASQVRPGASAASALPLGMLAGAAIIVVVTFVSYIPSLSCGFVWDDDSYVTHNRIIKSPDGLYRIWCTAELVDYYPLSNTMLWIEWRLWGISATGYHVVSLIMHIVSVLLIWLIMRKLSIPGAFLAAMIFAVHPVNVEAVAWIAQRKDMMAFLFFLLSILWYLKADMAAAGQGSRHTPCAEPAHGVCGILSSHWYWLSLAAFVLAMLSKGSVAMLPVFLLGIAWWLRPGTVPIFAQQKWDCPIYRRDLARTAPFFLVAAALTLVHIWFQTKGTGELIRNASFTERLLGAGGVVWFYLYKALLPINLIFVYPQWNIQAGNPLWWLPLLAALAVTAVLWRYRESWSRHFLFAWGFFCVALVPVMGFTDVVYLKYSLVADHYQHIAIIGVITLATAGISTWHERARGAAHWAAVVAVIVSVCVLSFLTWRQCGFYLDDITLYEYTLEKNPDCGMAHTNLGNTLLGLGRLPEAMEHFQQALRINANNAEASNNLGIIFFQTGRLQEAIEHYRQAVRIKSDFPEAHNNLANALAQAGRVKEAIEHYEQALRIEPDYSEAHNNLGVLLARTDRPLEAIVHYKHALALKPKFAEAHYNLGGALVQLGQSQEAIEHFQQALRLKPDFIAIWKNLASAYARMHQPDEAIAAAQKALELARSQGQTAQAKAIKEWLNVYQGQGVGGEGREKKD